MRYIIVGIEAGGKERGECEQKQYYCYSIPRCYQFHNDLEGEADNPFRCPACLEAEAKLAALKEEAAHDLQQ